LWNKEWVGPSAGEPDLTAVSVRAVAVFGGIEVSWTYPVTYPEAIAHTVIYRGTNNRFDQAIELEVATGNRRFDPINTVGVYYYWIEVVSVRGNKSGAIGPASARVIERKDYIIEDLTAMIDQGVLAQSLKDDIAKITLTASELQAEIRDRIAANALLGSALEMMNGDLDHAVTLIQSEISSRVDGQDALIHQADLLAAANSSNAAAIATESNIRLTADTALSERIESVLAATGNNLAAIQTLTSTTTDKDAALARQITDVMAATDANAATVQQLAIASANADSSLAQQISTVRGATDDNAAAVRNLTTTMTNADAALAAQISTVQSSTSTQMASVELNMQTQINSTNTWLSGVNDSLGIANGHIGNIGALLTARTSVNGLIGGFGVYNDGYTVESGFDVDTFWIGRTNEDKRKPFIIHNGVVYMDEVYIREATIDTLKLTNNAVTYTQAATTDESMAIRFAWTEIQTLVANLTAGWNIQLTPYMQFSIRNTSSAGMRLLRNGVQIWVGNFSCSPYNSDVFIPGFAMGMFSDSPGAGTFTYTLEACLGESASSDTGGSGGTVSNRNILGMVIKR
jgi:hypothetical protein